MSKLNLTLKNKRNILIAALILAGGQSNRMGQDKGQLVFDGCSLITHICTVTQDCLDFVFVITPSTQKYQYLLPKKVQIIKEKIILPKQKSNFPLLGFYQGFKKIDSEWLLLLACDLPKLNSQIIKEWLNTLQSIPSSTMAVLPKQDKGWEPICGFYNRRCLASLEEYLQNDGKSFQQWLKQIAVEELVVSDRSVLFNCNTWEDWQQFLRERESESQTKNSDRSKQNQNDIYRGC